MPNKAKKGLKIKVEGGCTPTIIKRAASLEIYPGTYTADEGSGADCQSHGGHEPVIIIVDEVEVVIDPGDPGVTVCTE